MRFHRVKIENLNSLYGVQTIDFEEDMRGSALFLIIGPTGAGKSTILDAICLSLFGQTPRLERRVGRADTDVAHIMSIGTAHAYAELDFSVLQGDGSRARFLASWSARRAYDDPEGAMQRPERSLYRKFDDSSMKLVVSDHREKYYQYAFDEALRGLSVDDFKRSMLLAQGEFSAFLHAADSEKASILERLTSTEQYRRIGERAARKRRDVDERSRQLMTRLDEMQLLTIPEEEELNTAIIAMTELVASAQAATHQSTKKVEWLEKLEELEAQRGEAAEGVAHASNALQARSEDQERLAKDAELLDVEPAWRAVERESTVVRDATGALVPLAVAARELAERETQLGSVVGAAEEALAKGKSLLAEAEPHIRRAHDLRTRRKAAHDEALRSKADQQTRTEALERSAALVVELTSNQTVALDATTAAKSRCSELDVARPILDRFPSIQAKFEDGIRPLREREVELSNQVRDLRLEIAEHAKELSRFDDEIGEANKERAKRQGQVTKVQNKLSKLLDSDLPVGDAVAKLSAQHDAAATRGEALRQARYLLLRIREQEKDRDEVYDRLKLIETEVAKLEADEALQKVLEASHLALVRSCEESIRQTDRVILLSAFRRDLHGGNPCPLCGSPLHPYCDSQELEELDNQAAADRARLDQELEAARAQLRASNESVQLLASKFIARKTALRHDESRLVALRTSLEEDQVAFSRAAEAAGYAPLEAFRLKNAELLLSDLADAEATTSTTKAQLEQLEQGRLQLDRVQAKLDETDAARAAVAERTESLREVGRQLNDRLANRLTDVDSTTKRLAARSEELLSQLSAFGVAVQDGPTIETALTRAAELRDKVSIADSAALAAAKAAEAAQQAVAREDERRGEAAAALKAATEQVRKRELDVAKIDSEIEACLNGRDPEEAKAELDGRVSDAQNAVDDSKAARAETAQLLSGNRARHEELTTRRDTASRALDAANVKLDATLKKLGIAREDVATHLLDAATRKRLQHELQQLQIALTRTKAMFDDVTRRLAQHTRTPLAAEDEALTDALFEQEAAAAALSDITLELGALKERWQAHEATRSRRADIEDELREVQHDVDVWNTIYQVIGVRDGERFKLFAQSLNLQGLVDKANARLEKLHARYELTVARGEGGEPTLTFMVRDRYQANVERPLTTLSGGETFLVSLALALGLADFRRIDMPIETLLLDEGFGSLDQDSLHMALTTLHQLHQDASRQIGIISHVDALKELIDARIVVEPRGHGRSELRFEFGAGESGTQLALV